MSARRSRRRDNIGLAVLMVSRPVWRSFASGTGCSSAMWHQGLEMQRRQVSDSSIFAPTSPMMSRRAHCLAVGRYGTSVVAQIGTTWHFALNNFIHHKSGSNEYEDKQTNITKLTLSSTYINRNIMVNHVSECVYKLSYQPNCTRLKISFLICLTEHLVIQI